jgi:methionyl-tRNA formyltransferase
MRVIFAGTSDFAVPSLEALIASPEHELLAVITQPDRPKGRGREMQLSPVKEVALAHGYPILQPEKISAPESLAEIKSYGPIGAMVVVAYGQKIPLELLEWPRRGVVNVHGSILPKYRGAAPIQHALIAGEKQTGVTTMLMDEGWDTGDILLQESLDILPDENAGELGARLALLGSRLLIRTLDGLEDGTVAPIPQDGELATMARSLGPDAGAIDWTRPADVIVNQVRGCTPRPGAYTRHNGSVVKIWKARVGRTGERLGEPGRIIAVHGDCVEVAAGEGSVDIIEAQAESRKRMSAADFARGAKLSPGDRFDVTANVVECRV